MTESHRSNPPPIAPSTDRITATSPAVAVHDARPPPLLPVESAEEEPYTIKCICHYTDDDGNTIYCEECDTWQHIECYYPGNVDDATRDDFDHSCVDCNPRVLDARQAAERQRLQRKASALGETPDKKTKRPPSKSHKKKTKPIDGQINGARHDADLKNGVHEHHSHAKKSKSGHRSHPSVSSQAAKRSPSYTARPKHPLSPVTTPPDLPDDLHVYTYSDHFIRLYDKDPGDIELQNNTYASLKVSDTLSSWLRNPPSLEEDLGVKSLSDIVPAIKADANFEQHPWPVLEVRSSKDEASTDTSVRWRYLVTTRTIQQKEGLVGELKGMIGFQKEYCNADSEAYARTCHPAPFVFFHPRLPIYIDTRQEGSRCRYARRSCQPNTSLEAFLLHSTEYRFCLTADRTIKAGEQITLPWDFRFKTEVRHRYLYLLGLSDDDTDHGPDRASESEYAELSELVYNVLSDHGGCACDLGNDCAFVRLHRNYLGGKQANASKPKKKSRPKQHISPTSTGHATNSRAASEGHPEYDAEDDTRSTSESVRSKPQSRDLTPFANHASDVPTLELSDRDKRKLAAIEESFQKIEQPPKKKKRASEGSNVSNGNAIKEHSTANTNKSRQKSVSRPKNSSPVPTNSTRPRQYVDASTSRQSNSPHHGDFHTMNGRSPLQHPLERVPAAHSPRHTPLNRPSFYTDSSTQTIEDKSAWYNTSPAPRTYIPLSQRLLQNRRHINRAMEIRRQREAESFTRALDGLVSPTSIPVTLDASSTTDENASADIVMTEAGEEFAKSPSISAGILPGFKEGNIADASHNSTSPAKPPPPSWPNETSGTTSKQSSERRAADLRIQMPAPPLLTAGQGLSAGSLTPSSTSSIAQSPLGTSHAIFSPSLAKSVSSLGTPTKTPKKLSLSDYRARLKKGPEQMLTTKTSAGTSPTMASATLPTASPIEPSAINGVLEGSAIVDTPSIDVVKDPIGNGTVIPTPTPTPAPATVSADTM